MKKYILQLCAMVVALTGFAQSVPQYTITVHKKADTPKNVKVLVGDKVIETIKAQSFDSIVVIKDLGVKIYIEGQLSRDYLDAIVQLEEAQENPTPDNPNVADDNRNKNIITPNDERVKYAWRIEYPKLKSDGNNLVCWHQASDMDELSYSLEWDCDKLAQRWSCFQFNAKTPNKAVKRGDGKFKVDPKIPEAYQIDKNDYPGTPIDRGHICAAEDRQTTTEEVNQTFYMSNMQPQHRTFNRGFWKKLEGQVQKWGYDRDFCDTLYVVKGGVIDDPKDVLCYTDEGRISNDITEKHLIVPGHFFMALLAVKDGEYKAVGFWLKHFLTEEEHKSEYTKEKTVFAYAMPIKDLEKLTHLDFFCNLKDALEEKVEAEYKAEDWKK